MPHCGKQWQQIIVAPSKIGPSLYLVYVLCHIILRIFAVNIPPILRKYKFNIRKFADINPIILRKIL
jgi:hypothetical protein